MITAPVFCGYSRTPSRTVFSRVCVGARVARQVLSYEQEAILAVRCMFRIKKVLFYEQEAILPGRCMFRIKNGVLKMWVISS